MKIAFCRFNQFVDLDYALGSVASRNTDQRVGVLHALVVLGHEVTIVSPVHPKHMHVFNGDCVGEFDYTWASALKYDLNADMSKFDLMIVETASGNTMFSYTDKVTKESVSFVKNTAEIFRRAKGLPVVIWQIDGPALAFPFARLSCLTQNITEEELAALSKNNYRHLFRDIDVFDGFEYTVWHQGYNSRVFMDVFSNVYKRPEVHIDRVISTVTGKCPIIDIEYPITPNNDLMYDLVYVGAAKPERLDKIRKYYDTPHLLSKIVGTGWDKIDWTNKSTAIMPGRDKVHGVVQSHYRTGLACVICFDRYLHEVSMTTTRHIQAMMSGCVVLVDGSLPDAKRHSGSLKYAVNTIEDVLQHLEWLDTDESYRRSVIDFQRASIPYWTDVMVPVLNVGSGKEKGDEW